MLYRPQKRVCKKKKINAFISQCHLERKSDYRLIRKIFAGTYEIQSPHFHSGNGYPNNTYCVWNVANSGVVNYHVMKQELQEPMMDDCDGPGCDCPDYVKIKKGRNEEKLCGNMLTYNYQPSPNGLHVKFCSDNKHTAKGIDIWATISEMQKREAKQVANSFK